MKRAMISFRPVLLFVVCCIVVACAEKIDLETPPVSEIFSVTDMVLTSDGRHLLVLSGNFDRRYDFGRVSVYDLDAREVVSSVLVDSIGGRLLLSPDERQIYVTTRERNRLHLLTLTRRVDGVLLLSYGLTKSLDDVSYIVHLEPYAMVLCSDEPLLFVTHLRNGEVSAFRREEHSLVATGTFALGNGVTAVREDVPHGVFLAAHKYERYLSLFRITANTPTMTTIVSSTLDLPLPQAGTDVRGLVSSIDSSTYYLSFRNIDARGTQYPVLVKFSLIEEGAGIIRAERQWATPLEGSLAEVAVAPCENGAEHEIVFAVSSDDSRLFALGGETGVLFARIELEDCTPYQVYVRPDDPVRRLFVGCFAEDRILIVDGNCGSETFLSTIGEVP